MKRAARPAPSGALIKLIDDLGRAGEAIIALRAGALSANLCGRLRIARDGEDPHALRLADCGCHFHIDWNQIEAPTLTDVDVGYGPEPTLILKGRDEEFLLQVHFQAADGDGVRAAFAAYALGTGAIPGPAAPVRVMPVPVTAQRPDDPHASDRLFEALQGCGIEVRFPAGRDWRGEDVTALEVRKALFLEAWSDPQVTHIWAALGGYGAGAMIEALKPCIAPPAGAKLLIGASDVSQLGAWLASRFEDAGFLHCLNCEDETIWSVRRDDLQLLIQMLLGLPLPERSFHSTLVRPERRSIELAGRALPVNATAARSLACAGLDWIEGDAILFLEDVNETEARLARMFDDLASAGAFARSRAVVLGTFSREGGGRDELIDPARVLDLASERAGIPVVSLGEFGHSARRMPILAGAPVRISIGEDGARVSLAFAASDLACAA